MIAKLNVLLGIIATLAFSLMLWLSDPVNSQARYANQQQRLYERQASAQNRLFTAGLVRYIGVGALVGVTIVGLRALSLRFTHEGHIREIRHLRHYERLEIETTKARYQPQISATNLHYSPHNTQHYSPSFKGGHYPSNLESLPNFQEDDSLALPLGTLPTFQESLALAGQGQIVFGYDQQHRPVIGGLNDLYSFGIGGMSGSGKTSTTAFLLAQACLAGAKLIVIDQHGGNDDSLTNKLAPLSPAYLCQPAASTHDIKASLELLSSIFETRKGLGNRGRLEPSIILVADEFLALMRQSDLAQPMKDIGAMLSQEGRKFGLYGAFISQKWSIASSGDMRDTLTSHLIHRTRPELARYQTGLKSSELPSDTMTLSPGQFYLLDNHGELQKLSAPYVSKDDLASLKLPSTSMEVIRKPQGNQGNQETSHTKPVLVDSSKVTSLPTVLSPENARLLSLFKQGKDLSEIVKEVYGVKSGRAYQEKLKHVNEVLRSLV